jgi:hypothetical protein
VKAIVLSAAMVAALLGAALAAAAPPTPPIPPVVHRPVFRPLPPFDPPSVDTSGWYGCDGRSPTELPLAPGQTSATAVDDMSRRMSGAAGVAACTEALARESDIDRRLELTLARAVHRMEASDNDAALVDARSIDIVAGARASDPAYQQTFRLTGLEFQAAALLRLGRLAEAETVALAMADLARYNMLAQRVAAGYARLTPALTPDKRAYYDRLGRLWSNGLLGRADADAWAGDWHGAAAELATYVQLDLLFARPERHVPPQVGLMALEAANLALAGDNAAAKALAAKTRADLDGLIAAGVAAKTRTDGEVVAEAGEMLDFTTIALRLAEGQAPQARAAFAARAGWTTVWPAMVAELSARLRTGAAPGELTGALAKDPAQIRAEGLDELAKSAIANVPPEALLDEIGPPWDDNAFKAQGIFAWRAQDANSLPPQNPADAFAGWTTADPAVVGIPRGEALLLNFAVTAQARGKTGFILFVGGPRQRGSDHILFVNPTDPGVPASAVIDAASVISTLGKLLPKPAP